MFPLLTELVTYETGAFSYPASSSYAFPSPTTNTFANAGILSS